MRRAASTSVSPSLDIYHVTTAMIHSNKLSIPIEMNDFMVENVETLGLIDSGAGGKFIDQNFAKAAGFEILKLEKPLRAFNVDGTENKKGTIKSYVYDGDITTSGSKKETNGRPRLKPTKASSNPL